MANRTGWRRDQIIQAAPRLPRSMAPPPTSEHRQLHTPTQTDVLSLSLSLSRTLIHIPLPSNLSHSILYSIFLPSLFHPLHFPFHSLVSCFSPSPSSHRLHLTQKPARVTS